MAERIFRTDIQLIDRSTLVSEHPEAQRIYNGEKDRKQLEPNMKYYLNLSTTLSQVAFFQTDEGIESNGSQS